MRDDFDERPEEPAMKWYLAKDGQQYGPLSDIEMTKFNELGHLVATDLLWRKGFLDWTPAGAVFEIKGWPKSE